MTGEKALEGIRFAVNAYADTINRCPIRNGASAEICTLCTATRKQSCGVALDADDALIKAVHHFTRSQHDASMPPAARVEDKNPLADRMGTSANQPHETVKASIQAKCYETAVKAATFIANELKTDATALKNEGHSITAAYAFEQASGAKMVVDRLQRLLAEVRP